MKPLRIVKPNPQDSGWKFPYASRERIDSLRQYFAHFATRLEGWKQQPRTHALPAKDRRPDIPWFSVPEQHREKVNDWFLRKLEEWKRSGRPLTAGKIQSLRMNAANYGRYVLTRKRAANRMVYERNKRIWLEFLNWQERQDRKEVELSRPLKPSKVLEL